MLREALNYLVDLGNKTADEPIEIDGRRYWKNSGQNIEPPRCDKLVDVETLDALLSALEAPDLTSIDKDRLEIVVESSKKVFIVSAADGTWRKREVFISATFGVRPFNFGTFMDIEEFIVRAQCMFEDNQAKMDLIAYVSSIVGEKVVENNDDGISQTVVVTNSANRKENSETKPVVELSPRRTFPEIEQPAGTFLLRIQDGPRAALFEADGGLWETKAVTAIAAYIRDDERVKSKGIAVIG